MQLRCINLGIRMYRARVMMMMMMMISHYKYRKAALSGSLMRAESYII